MTHRYSSCRSACLSAMCRLRDAFEHSTLPHSWQVNTFLGEAPATAKPSSHWSGPRVLPPVDVGPSSLGNTGAIWVCFVFERVARFWSVVYAFCPRELSITAKIFRGIRPCPKLLRAERFATGASTNSGRIRWNVCEVLVAHDWTALYRVSDHCSETGIGF